MLAYIIIGQMASDQLLPIDYQLFAFLGLVTPQLHSKAILPQFVNCAVADCIIAFDGFSTPKYLIIIPTSLLTVPINRHVLYPVLQFGL